MRHLLALFLLTGLLTLTGCNEQRVAETTVLEPEHGTLMEIDTTENLVVYFPQFTYIDLVCAEMPRFSDGSVLMCLAAAFTGERTTIFSHDNIAGQHVSSGVFHKGYNCPANTGAFTYHDGMWNFLPTVRSDSVTHAADASGMAFCQVMLVYAHRSCAPHIRGRNLFRALCEKDGKLCVAESRRQQDIGFFVQSLLHYGVKHAIYLQPGKGWNYSWYRDNAGVAHIMHPKTHDYSTNWLTFYQLQ